MPFTSLPASSLLIYSEILRRNKNDCSLSLDLLKNLASKFVKDKTKDQLIRKADEIAKEIIRCFKDSKGKKVVVVPISFSNTKKGAGTHANALVFNTKLMTAEHFEPHGRKDYVPARAPPQHKGKGLKGVNLSSTITAINKELKKQKSDLKFKYEPPLDVCPSESMFKNFYGVQSFDISKKEPVDYQGFKIKEMAGYCKLWTYFLLELRLKTLSQPASEVYAEYAKYRDIYKYNQLQDPNKSMMGLIRGYSKMYMDMITRLINEGKFSLEDYLKYRDRPPGQLPNYIKISTIIYEAVEKNMKEVMNQ